MRRAVPGLVTPASVGAVVAVLAAAYALAQPAPRQTGGLRPTFEDSDEFLRRETPRTARKRDTRPGAPANSQNPDTSATSFGNPPGFGAASTGFVSTNKKRRPAQRKGARTQSTQQGTTQRAPLPLTPPGLGATAGVPSASSATAATAKPTSDKAT